MMLRPSLSVIHSIKNRKHFLPLALALSLLAMTAYQVDWDEVQKLKVEYVSSAALHTMEMQKTSEASPVIIPFDDKLSAEGTLTINHKNSSALSVDIKAAPRVSGKIPEERILIPLSGTMDLFTHYTGVAVIVKTNEGTSPEVRVGLRLMERKHRSNPSCLP